MEDNNGTAVEQQQTRQGFQCSGDCLNCRPANERKVQWQYCAAQFTYNSMRMLQTMQESIRVMSGEIEELRAKIEAIQDNEALVFEPHTEEKSEKPIKLRAQKGDGVEIDAPR